MSDVYVSDVLERPELPEPLQVTAVHESPAVRLILCTVVCTVCVCGSLLVSARYGSVGIGLLATTRAAKERSPDHQIALRCAFPRPIPWPLSPRPRDH